MSKNLFVILDYNLSRIDDVRIMTQRAKIKHGLTTVLVRSKPGVLDQSLADHTLDLDPLGPSFVENAVSAIRGLGVPVALVPFSDNAVHTGALVAEQLGVVGDSARLAEAAFSKIAYRLAEKQVLNIFPQEGVMAPIWRKVNSLAEVEEFAKTAPKGFVIKPSCEGNNRGVVKVAPGDNLSAAFAEVAPYLTAGALCEALFELPEEYSYDGIGALTFITKKSVAKGRYPVEYGQTVPARLPAHLAGAIERAGALANIIVGQRIGPFHNEIKLDPISATTGVIEPNRRPAGMRIWHLARKVYGLDFFELWVDTLLGAVPALVKLEARGTAAIRMLASPVSGYLNQEFDEKSLCRKILAQAALVKLTGAHQLEWSDFKITAAPSTMVSDIIDDNSKFIAHITLFTPDSSLNIDAVLDVFTQEWAAVARDHLFDKHDLKKVS